MFLPPKSPPRLADRAQGKQGRLLQPLDPKCPCLSHTKLQALEKTKGLSPKFLPVRLNWFVKSRFILSFGY